MKNTATTSPLGSPPYAAANPWLIAVGGLVFFGLIAAYVLSRYGFGEHSSYVLMAGALIGGYMAMNIGANDVANNVGPAVGSGALSLGTAIVIAGIFEAAGALVAGGEVVGTIKSGIINPDLISESEDFIALMLAALLAGAVWLNVATAFGAPVSTTHSIVGGVLGAGLAAGGLDIANWERLAAIVSSWVISPMLGGLIAATFLFFIKRFITYQTDMAAAAAKAVPVLVAFMIWAFSTYLILKGMKNLVKVDFPTAAVVGLLIAVASYFALRPVIVGKAHKLENTKAEVNTLFTLPLIFSAALLSFAHGSNDVANAIGPLAAIHHALEAGAVTGKALIPLWIMIVGAVGIALGLAFFGPKLIRTVGSQITDLDRMRAFCVAMAAAITVIIASQLGLPVSSTHTAIGAIFGVGFLREFLKRRHADHLQLIHDHHTNPITLSQTLEEFSDASVAGKSALIQRLRASTPLVPGGNKSKSQRQRTELVKRTLVFRIIAAWVITVPVSGLMAAGLYFIVSAIGLGLN